MEGRLSFPRGCQSCSSKVLLLVLTLLFLFFSEKDDNQLPFIGQLDLPVLREASVEGTPHFFLVDPLPDEDNLLRRASLSCGPASSAREEASCSRGGTRGGGAGRRRRPLLNRMLMRWKVTVTDTKNWCKKKFET